MGLLGEALDITWSITSFFAVSENSSSAKSINFDINRKKIENWAIPYKELIGKKHVFLKYIGFQTSEGDKQYRFLVENFQLF